MDGPGQTRQSEIMRFGYPGTATFIDKFIQSNEFSYASMMVLCCWSREW